MAQKIELRRKNNGSFSTVDDLMLPVTHIDAVLGLLDDNKKVKLSLLPDSMLNTKRMAGSINADTNFANMFALVQSYNDTEATMYPGTYFISNGKRLITASNDHVIYYNDDGLNASTEVELENGDHLFYVKFGKEHAWNDTGNTVSAPNTGIADLAAPNNTILGSHIFATGQEMAAFYPAASGLKALITGYKWAPSTLVEYNAAGSKIEKSGTFGGSITESDANRLLIPSYDLWDYGQGALVLRINDGELGTAFWKLTKVDDTFTGDPKVYESVQYTNKHMWGVVNNSYGLATTASAGLMSAVDKFKLNSLSNYEHPNHAAINEDTSGISVISGIQTNTYGHVTNVSTRALPSASTDIVGVVELATVAEGRIATDASRALTPASGLAMLNHNQDVSYFASVATANAANLPDGAIAIIPSGTITI